MRSTLVIVLAVALSGCSILEQIQFGGSSLDPTKVYLSATDVISVAPRQTYRYACVGQPLLCMQHGIDFECRCP